VRGAFAQTPAAALSAGFAPFILAPRGFPNGVKPVEESRGIYKRPHRVWSGRSAALSKREK
jgi:hypothetical protein